eukprot:6185797-Pleurochrysis_carterae.AAC.1
MKAAKEESMEQGERVSGKRFSSSERGALLLEACAPRVRRCVRRRGRRRRAASRSPETRAEER